MTQRDPGSEIRVSGRESRDPGFGWNPGFGYRGTSLIRNNPLLGPYSRTMSGDIWWPEEGGLNMSEVPL